MPEQWQILQNMHLHNIAKGRDVERHLFSNIYNQFRIILVMHGNMLYNVLNDRKRGYYMANKTSEKKMKTNQAYLNQLEDIKIRVPKGYRGKIQEYAKNQGLSVNQLVIRSIQLDAQENNYDLQLPTGMRELKQENSQTQEENS